MVNASGCQGRWVLATQQWGAGSRTAPGEPGLPLPSLSSSVW